MDKNFEYKDYKEKKRGDFQSAGMFGDSVYAYEKLVGFANTPEYRQITKNEFETFEEWSKEDSKELGVLADVLDRDILCSGTKGNTAIKEIQTEVTCPVCNTSFLLPEEDIPDEEDLYIYCPNCNKPSDLKLIDEIKRQLKKAEIKIDDLVSMLKRSYINPERYHENRRYVEIVKEKYQLKTQVQGKLTMEAEVADPIEAAYWIILQVLFSMEDKKVEKEQKKKREKKIMKALEIELKKMDGCYYQWFTEKRFLDMK